MQNIPDIAYVFLACVVLAVVYCFVLYVGGPAGSIENMLTLAVGGLIGLATRHASDKVSTVTGDIAVGKKE